MGDERDFDTLATYLRRIPAITGTIGAGRLDDGNWWVKFSIDIDHPLAWNVVQELGCVLNYLSVQERLPTVFMPVSPAPYLNGGPREFLSWVIESKDPQFKPGTCKKWLEGRLPNPRRTNPHGRAMTPNLALQRTRSAAQLSGTMGLLLGGPVR